MWIILGLLLAYFLIAMLPDILVSRWWRTGFLPELLYLDEKDNMERVKEAKDGRMNYFIAGIWNQPSSAFEFLRDFDFYKDAGVTEFYHSVLGMNYEAIYKMILNDIRDNGYTEVRIFTISIACRVARYFNLAAANHPETLPAGTKISCYEINPYWTPDFAKPSIRFIWRVLAVVAKFLVRFVLAFLAYIPVIKQSGHWFSLKHTSDVLWNYGTATPVKSLC